MAGQLLHVEKSEYVTLPADAVRRLMTLGDGDGALLYLAIAAGQGSVHTDALAHQLRWDAARLARAQQALESAGLLKTSAPVGHVEEPAEERPTYTQEDIAGALETDGEFSALLQAVEQFLGYRLTTPDTAILLHLYSGLALPADVIYLLISYCKSELEAKNGASRRLAMRYVEKVGYEWRRLGVDTQAEANEYIKRRQAQREKLPRYMRLLGLGDRKPSTTEDKYLMAWIDAGLEEDIIALAYDRTVLHCKELRWGYMNGILKRWLEKGARTAQAALALDAAPRQMEKTTDRDNIARMKKYVEEIRKGK